jgi:late competence protein required for DNA uptake (superfamily II DNA/RNA helicase)
MNLSQLHKDFGTQKKCIAYLEKLRWGKTPTCANCESTNVSKRTDILRWYCNSCLKMDRCLKKRLNVKFQSFLN